MKSWGIDDSLYTTNSFFFSAKSVARVTKKSVKTEKKKKMMSARRAELWVWGSREGGIAPSLRSLLFLSLLQQKRKKYVRQMVAFMLFKTKPLIYGHGNHKRRPAKSEGKSWILVFEDVEPFFFAYFCSGEFMCFFFPFNLLLTDESDESFNPGSGGEDQDLKEEWVYLFYPTKLFRVEKYFRAKGKVQFFWNIFRR